MSTQPHLAPELVPPFSPAGALQETHSQIWSQSRERQNRLSSSWWFFLLFPEGPDGYGPRQLMFTIAARVGQRMNISGLEMDGMSLNRPVTDAADVFPGAAVGWYCDGERVYHDYVHEAATAELSRTALTLSCRTDGPPEDGYGMTITPPPDHPLGLRAEVRGREYSAAFDTWGDLDARHSGPDRSMDIDTPFGGVDYIALRKLNFEGEFDLPTGREHLKGLGFFQRVAMNFPVFPWKWIYTLFPDGSMFTAYTPYVGLNVFRKGYHFFSSNRLEQAALPVTQSAMYFAPGASEPVKFNRVIARPLVDRGPHPHFEVEARNGQGDVFAFHAASYGHARFYIDRPVAGGLLSSHWTYNEYIFRMEALRGQIAGRVLSQATMGQGYGNLEYTWGLGL